VITHEVIGGARDGDTSLEQLQLELAQLLVAAAVGVGGQRPDVDAALHGALQGFGNRVVVEPEDQDVDRPPGALDRLDDRRNARIRLNDELHGFDSKVRSL
jgi:hypothetical protein